MESNITCDKIDEHYCWQRKEDATNCQISCMDNYQCNYWHVLIKDERVFIEIVNILRSNLSFKIIFETRQMKNTQQHVV